MRILDRFLRRGVRAASFAEGRGSPVAVNMVWLLAHTTVVAKSAEEAPVTRTWRRPRETSAPAQPVSVPISRAPASRPIAWA